MPLILQRCNESDYPRAFEILSQAFGNDLVFINGFWPQHQTARGRADGAERLRIWAREQSWTTFVKVINTEAFSEQGTKGLMIGMAKWNVYDHDIPPEEDIDGPWWDEGRGDKAYAQALRRAFTAGRRQAILDSGGNLVCMYDEPVPGALSMNNECLLTRRFYQRWISWWLTLTTRIWALASSS